MVPLTKINFGIFFKFRVLSVRPRVIGAYVCLYPLKFAISGEVGETTTKKYLKEKFNLFQSVEEVSYDSATLMRYL